MGTKFSFPFLLAVAIAYIIMGCAVMYFQPYFNLPVNAVYGFGGLCIVYGLFRLYRANSVHKGE